MRIACINNVIFRYRGQLRAQSHELARNGRAPRARRTTHDRAWKLTDHVRHVVLIIYTLTAFASRPAVVYLRNCGRSRHWQNKTDEELAELVSTCYRSADEEQLARCLYDYRSNTFICCCCRCIDMANPLNGVPQHIARRYVGEWSLVQEGAELNLNGVAPTTRMLVDRAKQLGLTLPPAVSNAGPREFNRPSAAERKWALRFRRRWDARLGKIKAVEPLTSAEMIAKVSSSVCVLALHWSLMRNAP